MISRDRLVTILGWAAFAFACSAFFLPIINPDLFWHLSAGKAIAWSGAIPRADTLSWTMQGQPWHDFEWLTQAIYYSLYVVWGFHGLMFLKALLLGLTLLAFRSIALLYGRRAALPLALPFFAAAIVTNSDLRPENFTLLFFTVELYALERRRLGRLPGGWPLLAAAAAFFCLWANLHAGYLYGLALAGLYAAGEFFTEELPYIYGKAPFARPSGSLGYLWVFFTGLAASLANPYGLKIYSVISNHQQYINTLQEYIQEWNTFDLLNIYQWPYVLALAGVLGSAAFFVLRRRHAAYTHFACLLFFVWASANHARHIPFFIITGLAFTLALPWQDLKVRPRAVYGAAAAAAALLAWFYAANVWTQYTGRITGFRWGSDGLAVFLRANKAELSGLRVYNPWGWGGWLGWHLGPDYKVFVDGRYLFHDKIAEIIDVRESPAKWRELMDKYRFDLMLVQLDDLKVPMKHRLKNGTETLFWRPAWLFYLPRREWAIIYWDSSVLAAVRRSAADPRWLAEKEYRWLRPGDTLNLVQPALAGEVKISELQAEADRYLRNHQAGHETSLNSGVISFMRGIRELCARKEARCAD